MPPIILPAAPLELEHALHFILLRWAACEECQQPGGVSAHSPGSCHWSWLCKQNAHLTLSMQKCPQPTHVNPPSPNRLRTSPSAARCSLDSTAGSHCKTPASGLGSSSLIERPIHPSLRNPPCSGKQLDLVAWALLLLSILRTSSNTTQLAPCVHCTGGVSTVCAMPSLPTF